MAKKPRDAGGIPLVIVESPAKARTISKFLGRDYTIEASIGHIRDLPHGAKEIPEQYKKEDWAYLGVNVNHGFEPVYVIPHGKDRPGAEAEGPLEGRLGTLPGHRRRPRGRGHQLASAARCSSPRCPSTGWCFHEITEEAIRDALEQPAADRRRPGAGAGGAADHRSARTATTFRRCCGGRSGRGCRPAACRALPCG